MKKHRSTSASRFLSLSILAIIRFISVVAVLGGLIYAGIDRQLTAFFIPGAALGVCIVTTAFIYIIGSNATCPLCRCTPFVVQRKALRKDSLNFCGSATFPMAIKLIVTGKMDCPYCEFSRNVFKQANFNIVTPERAPTTSTARSGVRTARRAGTLPARNAPSRRSA